MKLFYAINLGQRNQWGIAMKLRDAETLELQMFGVGSERAAQLAGELNRHEEAMQLLAGAEPKPPLKL